MLIEPNFTFCAPHFVKSRAFCIFAAELRRLVLWLTVTHSITTGIKTISHIYMCLICFFDSKVFHHNRDQDTNALMIFFVAIMIQRHFKTTTRFFVKNLFCSIIFLIFAKSIIAYVYTICKTMPGSDPI